MSASTTGVRNAFLLWLSGIRLADVCTLPEMEGLLQRGALVELDPSPITGPHAHHYQIFSGQSPARSGFFDSLLPQCHLPGTPGAIRDYTVIEADTGRGTPPQMLPDLLRTAGWSVEYEEASAARLLGCVRTLTMTQPVGGGANCKIVKCELGAGAAPFGTHRAAVADALHAARSWVGEDGLLAVFSDIQPAQVHCFVNVNTFLAEMELLERDEQHGLINWADSLAYYAGHGQLWVNLLGREPQGAVHPRHEYEEVCATLIKALPAKLRDSATGAQVIERVYRKEELYPSEYLFCAPDLVVVFEPGYAPSPQSTLLGFDEEGTCWRPVAGTTTTAGAHPITVGGFLLACAPALSQGVAMRQHIPLTAVVPTLLHALGIAYTGMDSPAAGELFSQSYLETHPIRTQAQNDELSEEDEELVINRLRDLGYV